MSLSMTAAPSAAMNNSQESENRFGSATLTVENMACGACMNSIENCLNSLSGVNSARANLSVKRVFVSYDPHSVSIKDLLEILGTQGYRAAEYFEDGLTEQKGPNRDLLKRVGVAGFAAANIMLLSVSVWAGAGSDMSSSTQTLFHWLSALIALPAIAYAGQPFFASAFEVLKAGRLTMDVPISLAIILATGMSLYQTVLGTTQVYFDAGVTLLFFLLSGRYLDQMMRRKAHNAAQNLLSLQSMWATVINEDGTAEQKSARDIEIGEHVLVTKGQQIPVDGRLLSGTSLIDENLITGETLPRSAKPQDFLYAGTINLSDTIQIEAKAVNDSTLHAEIGRLMTLAEQARGKYVRIADRAARIYAPTVHLLGALAFLLWILYGAGWEYALTIAISVLIITCPCALALAVPAVQVVAASRLFRSGMILKSSDGLERLADIDTVVFDKTGTLTTGIPELINVAQIPAEILQQAARLSVSSQHPYAQAIVHIARSIGLIIRPASSTVEVAGSGIKSEYGGQECRLGNWAWVHADLDFQSSPPNDGEATLYYRSGQGKITPFVFQDRLRSDATFVIDILKKSGLQLMILSGDRISAVRETARRLSIANWYGQQKPDEKFARLEALRSDGAKILMIGDGLNDAPSLAAGHASLSPSSAARICQTSADVIYQGEKLNPIIEVLAIAKMTRKLSLQNFAIAAGYNAVCIPLAVAGLVTPLVAAITMSASSMVVTLNALRLSSSKLELIK